MKIYPGEYTSETEFYSLTDGKSQLQSEIMLHEVVKVASEYRNFDMVDPSRLALGRVIPEDEVFTYVQTI